MNGYKGNSLTYTLINKYDRAMVTCSKKYLAQWLARGFEIYKIDKVPYSMDAPRLKV